MFGPALSLDEAARLPRWRRPEALLLLMAAAMNVARQVAALPRSGVENYKRCMRDGMALPYGEARTEERRRAFAQYRALPESFFAKMKAAAGLAPRAKL